MAYQKLKIQDYALWLHLGVSDQERHKPQQVNLSLEIEFLEPLKACDTDQLEDTVCYDLLTTQIAKELHSKSFKTIEFLAKEIFDFIKPRVSTKNRLQIHIHKVSPPMPHILGGTHFYYGDNP